MLVSYGSPGKKPTKTGKIRRVTLFGLALEAAKAQAAALNGKSNPRRIFWPNSAGNFRYEGSPDGWNDWLEAAGLVRPVRVYDLRHTFASSLVAGWWGQRWTLEEIKAPLGHTDIKMTQRYAHIGVTAVSTSTRDMLANYSGPRLVPNVGKADESIQGDSAFVNRKLTPQAANSYRRLVPSTQALRVHRSTKRREAILIGVLVNAWF